MRSVFLFGLVLLAISCRIRYIELNDGKVIRGRVSYTKEGPVVKHKNKVVPSYHIDRVSKHDIRPKTDKEMIIKKQPKP